MSDEPRPNKTSVESAEGVPPGAAMLITAALQSPEPSPDAETASQARAVSAYQEALLDPRPLRAESWNPASPSGLAGRVTRFLRRLQGR